MDGLKITERPFDVGGTRMTFRFRESGPPGGTPVLLLHGFPETSAMWEPALVALGEAGYHAVAPDQRGYSPGARPDAVDAYAPDELIGDVGRFLTAAGGPVHLVGHDWGAGVAWGVAMSHPEWLRSLTVLSVPHLVAFRNAFHNDPEQRSKSSYFELFRQPGVAEAAFAASDHALLLSLWMTHDGRPFDQELLDEYVPVFTKGGLTPALNWYRAMHLGHTPDDPRVALPTLHLWGRDDPALGRSATEATAQFMTGPYKLVEMDAGHWLVQDDPATVTREILAHIRSVDAAGQAPAPAVPPTG